MVDEAGATYRLLKRTRIGEQCEVASLRRGERKTTNVVPVLRRTSQSKRAYSRNVDATGERRGKILERLNEINRGGMFGATYLLDGEPAAEIIFQHQLLGDDLESVELLNALGAAAIRANTLDDELIEAFGTGEKWADVTARWQAGAGGEQPIPA